MRTMEMRKTTTKTSMKRKTHNTKKMNNHQRRI
jgi:hypothetical protein